MTYFLYIIKANNKSLQLISNKIEKCRYTPIISLSDILFLFFIEL